MNVSRKHASNGGGGARQVIGSKDGLVEFLVIDEREWDIKANPLLACFFVGVDQNHSVAGEDHKSGALVFGEVFYLYFEL